MTRIQYVGHATIIIETGEGQIIIDPYLKGEGREGLSRYNPNAALSLKDVTPDLIQLTHGHGDHFGQTLELLERTGAKLVASNGVCDFIAKRTKKELDLRGRLLRIEPAGKLVVGELTVLALGAKHRHGLEGMGGDLLGLLAYSRYTPCGTNMGYLMTVQGKKIYHSGDTCVVKGVQVPDVAFLSMDGIRTMNEEEAVLAIREIRPRVVVPIHYKWREKGIKVVEKVKEAVEGESVSFKEMAYGEAIEI
jgi:L-ascorbate metabolism protein UlaG (beta-lactamase superfamily)